MDLLQSRPPRSESSLKRPLRRQHAVLISLDPCPYAFQDIKDVLSVLHATYPALHYPLYEAALRINGVNELADALKFRPAFYAETVGMPYGAAYLFCKCIIEEGTNLKLCRDGEGIVVRH